MISQHRRNATCKRHRTGRTLSPHSHSMCRPLHELAELIGLEPPEILKTASVEADGVRFYSQGHRALAGLVLEAAPRVRLDDHMGNLGIELDVFQSEGRHLRQPASRVDQHGNDPTKVVIFGPAPGVERAQLLGCVWHAGRRVLTVPGDAQPLKRVDALRVTLTPIRAPHGGEDTDAPLDGAGLHLRQLDCDIAAGIFTGEGGDVLVARHGDQGRESKAGVGSELLIIALRMSLKVHPQSILDGVPRLAVQALTGFLLNHREVLGRVSVPVQPLIAARITHELVVDVIVQQFDGTGVVVWRVRGKAIRPEERISVDLERLGGRFR